MKTIRDVDMRRIHKKLPHIVGTYRTLADNRDRRGVRQSANAKVRTTLKHLECALRYRNAHPDDQVRRGARKLLASISHEPSFEDLAAAATAFAGKVRASGQRRNERARRQARARTITINKEMSLEKVTTPKHLQDIGHEFANCLRFPRGDGAGHHEDFRDGDTEFWVLRQGTTPYCLIELNKEERRINDCLGPRNETPQLPRAIKLAILRCLDASADDVEAFARDGAYRCFVTTPGAPPPTEIDAGGQSLAVWAFRNELVIKRLDCPDDEMAWALFAVRDGQWTSDRYAEIKFEDLLNYGLDSQTLWAVLQDVKRQGTAPRRLRSHRRAPRGRRAGR